MVVRLDKDDSVTVGFSIRVISEGGGDGQCEIVKVDKLVNSYGNITSSSPIEYTGRYLNKCENGEYVYGNASQLWDILRSIPLGAEYEFNNHIV